MKREITKQVRQVTGTSEGITFTKEDKEILNIKKGSIVKVISEEPFMVNESELTQEEKDGAIELGK